jgi:hypothetical protein
MAAAQAPAAGTHSSMLARAFAITYAIEDLKTQDPNLTKDHPRGALCLTPAFLKNHRQALYPALVLGTCLPTCHPDKPLITVEWVDKSDKKNLYTVVSADTVHTFFTFDYWIGPHNFARMEGKFNETDKEMYDTLVHNIGCLEIQGYINTPILEAQMKMALANVLNWDFTLAGKSQAVQRGIKACNGEVPQLDF